MAGTNHSERGTHRIGKEMDAPYRVDLDGRVVAEFKTPEESDAYLQQLLGELRGTPPAELANRFAESDVVRFELLRCTGPVRLWKSTETPQQGIERVKFHVTGSADASIFITDHETASVCFGVAAALAKA